MAYAVLHLVSDGGGVVYKYDKESNCVLCEGALSRTAKHEVDSLKMYWLQGKRIRCGQHQHMTQLI